MEINFTPTLKQDEVFELFEDKHTKEILYGGGVGSAKTYLLASLVTIKCLQHEGIRVGLARNELTTLKKTTVISFFEVFKNWGLQLDVDYKYNPIAGHIRFTNGSEIVFQELRFLPSDPDYTRLGGLLLTFAVIDEAGECDAKAAEILSTRCGRWMNEETGIKKIILYTCNPSRNFLYDDFYAAKRDGTMEKHRAFVSATAYDNPYIDPNYIDDLLITLSFGEVQRLLNGNWEYSGDPDNLLQLEEIKMIYNTDLDIVRKNDMYISADIAFTSDSCVIMVWDGLTVIKIVKLDKDANVEEAIKKLAIEYNVRTNKIAYDSDGVGKYLMQYLKGAKAIVNNSKALKGENYINLKTQLYFKLCELISKGDVKCIDKSYRKEVEEELLCVKHKPKNTTEGKMEMNSKDSVKRILGHSPDFSDAMAYRMFFEFKKTTNYNFG